MAFSLALGVTPELLKAKANEVQESVDGMRYSFQRLSYALLQTDAFWKIEAGNLFRKNYNDRQGEIERLLMRMQSYPDRILKMAGIYEAAEDENERIASVLGGDLNLR